MIITKLSNIGAHKVSVKSYHAGVLTLDGRAFLWGRNDYHQVTLESDVDQSSPKLFNNNPNERIKDISCGTYHTSLLSYKMGLFYIGKGKESLYKFFTSPLNSDGLYKKQEMNKPKNMKEVSSNCLFATTTYTFLNQIYVDNDFILENLINEQKFLEHMLIVHGNFMKLIMKKVSMFTDPAPYENLYQTYTDLMNFIAANIKTLIEFSNRTIPECDIIMFKCVDEHLFIYKNYLETLCGVISVGGCKCISKTIDVPQCVYKVMDANVPKRDKKNDELLVHSLLAKPYERLSIYQRIVDNVSSHTNKADKFKDVSNKWSHFVENQGQKYKESLNTRDFWINSGKTISFLKSQHRRLIRESNTYPIHLQNASIFSSHWFVLLNDCFVHLNGSVSNVHDLKTIWVEPQQDLANGHYQISLKMPEDSIELYSNEGEDKIQWFHALQAAIKGALGKLHVHQPPVCRSATYTFCKNGYYKDATFSGRWLNGKMHGSGKIQWPDGRIYTGQFNNNFIHGFGRMDIPDIGKHPMVNY